MNKIKYTTALFLGGLLSFSSCTDNFADFNSTDGAYTEELQKYDQSLAFMNDRKKQGRVKNDRTQAAETHQLAQF